jgi:hypothetical protein
MLLAIVVFVEIETKAEKSQAFVRMVLEHFQQLPYHALEIDFGRMVQPKDYRQGPEANAENNYVQ